MEQTDRDLLLELRKEIFIIKTLMVGVPDTGATGLVGKVEQIGNDTKLAASQCPVCKQNLIAMITTVKEETDKRIDVETKEIFDKIDKVKMSVWKLALIIAASSVATGGIIEALQQLFA